MLIFLIFFMDLLKFGVSALMSPFSPPLVQDSGYAGNHYSLVQTIHGVKTFAHKQTGQWLHGQVGPVREAQDLYVHPSGIAHTSLEKVVIYDVGMGCAGQVLASWEAFRQNPLLKSLHVVSFDLDHLGLVALLENLEHMPHAIPYSESIQNLIASHEIVVHESHQKTFKWTFLPGDFPEVLKEKRTYLEKHPAHHIFYDFFSPSVHPHLWHSSVFRSLYQLCCREHGGQLYTYCSATAVRASLLAAGFYVGYGSASGTNKTTTLAHTHLEALQNPLTLRWKATFENSTKPYVPGEPESEHVQSRLISHPQWLHPSTQDTTTKVLR